MKTCQNCGAQWVAPEDGNYPFLRFVTDPVLHSHREISLLDIFQADATILRCPKCPIPELDQAMYKGDNRYTAGDETEPRP